MDILFELEILCDLYKPVLMKRKRNVSNMGDSANLPLMLKEILLSVYCMIPFTILSCPRG